MAGIKGKFSKLPTMTHNAETGLVVTQVDGITYTFDAIKGEYPKWREAIPKQPEPSCLQMDRTIFNPGYITRALVFIRKLHQGPLDIYGKQGEPAVFKCNRCMCAIMPGRTDQDGKNNFAPFA